MGLWNFLTGSNNDNPDESLVYLTPEENEPVEEWAERVLERVPVDHSDDEKPEEPRHKLFGLF